MKTKTISTKKIAAMAMFTAMSIVLVSIPFLQFSMFLPFLKYDPADIPILMCAFMLGPWEAVGVTFAAAFFQSLAIAGDFPYGFIMHLFATGSMAVTAGFIYKKIHTFKGAVISLATGMVVWLTVMIICNIFITPIYTDAPRDEIIKLLLPAIIPFNLIKSGINCVVTMIIYKNTHRVFKRIFNFNDNITAPHSFDSSQTAEDNDKAVANKTK